MAFKILVDTDVLIDFLRKKEAALHILEQAVRGHDLYISVITLAEILAGMRESEKPETEALLEGLALLPIDEAIARKAGALRHRTKSKKSLLPDCLIAATALLKDCQLLTFNRRDYQHQELNFYSP